MDIISRGELGYRLTQSYSRLESNRYLPEVIWSADKNCWYGDWEGRTILALVALAGATKKEPSYLEEILDMLPQKLNAQGYIGEIYPDAEISEQQLAGNSWLLRGLIEYTYLTGSDRCRPIIEGMVRNLYLPILDAVREYPIEEYEEEGNYSGSIIAKRGRWLLSSDIGCVFISMDGISAAYELLGWNELRVLLEGMIERYEKVAFYEARYQTHATLSALRGILRTYRLTGKAEYLELVRRVYALYLKKGTTETHANTTRFQVPTWTEPCAIVDSYMIAVELYAATGECAYLETAQEIYLNAISHAQLPNGGMGLENCVGHEGQEFLTFLKKKTGAITEAYWCCSMRGADGLSYVSRNQCKKQDGAYHLIHFFDAVMKDGATEITIKTKYPYEGRVFLSVKDDGKTVVRLFMPRCMKNIRVNGAASALEGQWLTLRAEGEAEFLVEFDIPLVVKDAAYGAKKLYHGLMLLGCPDENDLLPVLQYAGGGKYLAEDGRCFSSVGRTVFKDEASVTAERLQVLFRPKR